MVSEDSNDRKFLEVRAVDSNDSKFWATEFYFTNLAADIFLLRMLVTGLLLHRKRQFCPRENNGHSLTDIHFYAITKITGDTLLTEMAAE